MKKMLALALLAAVLPVFPASVAQAKDKEEVVVYNWGEYMDPDVIADFEKETGIKVVYEEFETNEIMYPKVAAGAAQYDLICPSDYMISKMLANDMLQPINFDHIPNYANIDEKYIEQSKSPTAGEPSESFTTPPWWMTPSIPGKSSGMRNTQTTSLCRILSAMLL